jgi:hypothetical protein
MKKIQLKLAVAAALLGSAWHRATAPDTIALGNSNPPPAPPDAAAENAALKESLALRDTKENLIRKKMAAGLSRAQAEVVVQRQAEFTKRNTEVTAARKAAKKK